MADPTKARKLTPKQERFCQLYVTYWNATRAAVEAKYSPKSAMWLGYQLLQNPLVKERIAQLSEHALAEIGVTRERILTEYARIAFFDLADVHDNLGRLLSIKDMPEHARRAISKIKTTELFAGQGDEKTAIGLVNEIEVAPKKPALDSLAKIQGYLSDNLKHSGQVNLSLEDMVVGSISPGVAESEEG